MDAAIDSSITQRSALSLNGDVFLPPEVRGTMPCASLVEYDKKQNPRFYTSPVAGIKTFVRRFLVLGGAVTLAGYTMNEMRRVLNLDGMTLLELLVLLLFTVNMLWISVPAVTSLIGFFRLLSYRQPKFKKSEPLKTRTAILMPLHNENPAQVGAALDAMALDLIDLGEGHSFDIFILSDTTDGNIALAEEEAIIQLRQRLQKRLAVYYRRRRHNLGHKSGNIQEFCERWGTAYEHLLIFDADSLMSGRTIIELVKRMELDCPVGLIQTVPQLHNSNTLIARLQQFAGRVYGPPLAAGLAWWTGKEGNFWGHNAILRTRAFMASAGLPVLPGNPPKGGPIMSHDFVEAALIRRAGWAVLIADDLTESYEACPQTLTDIALRDRRWCQGNLQHLQILRAKGLHWISRLHLLTGIFSYVSSPLWLLFLIMTLTLGIQNEFSKPEYFGNNYTLFPLWPHLDPVRALRLFVITLVILMAPKALGMLSIMIHPKVWLASGGLRFPISVILEVGLSALIAPILMLVHCGYVLKILMGYDGGWKPQQREGNRLPLSQITYFHRWHIFIGATLSLVGFAISWDMYAWLLPATISMIMAVPISLMAGSPMIGRWVQNLLLLRTPVEAWVPTIVASFKRALPIYQASVEGAPDLIRLLSDPHKLQQHCASLDKPELCTIKCKDIVEAVANYKVSRAQSLDEVAMELTPEEYAFILSSSDLLRKLSILPAKHAIDSQPANGFMLTT